MKGRTHDSMQVWANESLDLSIVQYGFLWLDTLITA
jgi:hypothetical protein